MKRFLGAMLALGICCSAAAAEGTASDTADADHAFFAGRFTVAGKLYAAVSADSASYEAAQRQLGAIALFENRLDDAERFLNSALATDPNDAKAEVLLAEAASRRGEFAAAAAWLTKAGKPERAAGFAAFEGAAPYRIISEAANTRAPFLQTDPLPAVEASVNGMSGVFLIDTGAADIVLDPAFAKAAGIAAVGGDTGTFAGGKTAGLAYGRIAKFAIARLETADVPAILLSTAGFSGAAGGRPVAGVIGTAFLSRFRSTIDYPEAVLILDSKDAPLPDSEPVAEIPFLFVRDHFILARGQLDDGPEQLFLVDTGLAGYAFTAPSSTLLDAGVTPPKLSDPSAPERVGESAAAPFAIDSLRLDTLRRHDLGGLYGPFPATLETSTGVHIGGIISHAFFRPYALTFDFVRMKIELHKPPT